MEKIEVHHLSLSLPIFSATSSFLSLSTETKGPQTKERKKGSLALVY